MDLETNLLQKFLKYNHSDKIQLDSFNYFLHHSVHNILENEVIENEFLYCKIESVKLNDPTHDGIPVTPEFCIENQLSYAGDLVITVNYYIKKNSQINKDISTKHIKKTFTTTIGKIPFMVGYKCNDLDYKVDFSNRLDNKCYFIVKGAKKVICMEERIAYNYPFLLNKKKDFKFVKYVEYKSMNLVFKSSLIDIGAKLFKNKYKILVYSPDLALRELIPIRSFLNLFFDDEAILEGFRTIINLTPTDYQHAVSEILYYNLTPIIDVRDFILKANIKIAAKDINVLLKEKFLIHMNNISIRKKGIFVLYLLKILLFGLVGITQSDDRDHYGNKRVYTVNHFFTSELYNIFHKKFKRNVLNNLAKKTSIDDEMLIKIFEKNPEITTNFKSCLTTNTWHGKNLKTCQFVSQHYDPFNKINELDMKRKIITPIKSDTNKITHARDLNLTQSEIICPYSTPDGKKIGLIKHASIQAICSLDSSENIVSICKTILEIRSHTLFQDESFETLNYTPILVNGCWIGNTDNIFQTLNKLKKIKCQLLLFDVSIFYNKKINTIVILSDAGRLLFPIVQKKIDKKFDMFIDYIYHGYISFLDKNEIETEILNENDIFQQRFKEIEYPSNLFSVLSLSYAGATIPFSNHNQSPRNIYQCQMSKQAIGFMEFRDDPLVYNILSYPQIPLVHSFIETDANIYEYPTGTNAIVCLMPYFGENQEDSLIMNKSAIERGMFSSVRNTTFKQILDNSDILYKPDPEEVKGQVYNFTKLDNNGIIKKGAIVKKNDVMISVKKQKTAKKAEAKLIFTQSDMTIIETKIIYNDKGENIIKIVATESLYPKIGDKYASRHAQKGTIGMIIPQIDMPFFSDGITPDIIMNPLGIPSRMTVGHMLEMISGKIRVLEKSTLTKLGVEYPLSKLCSTCLKYKRTLNSPRCNSDCFLNNTIQDYLYNTTFYSKLIPEHIKEWKSEVMYCAFTGEQISSLVFSGVIYYQKLKHLSKDKIYVRTIGPIQPVTRQPKEGRSVDGGHRFGIQERDCMIAQGCAYGLRDRLFLNSDYYKLHICECGTIYHGPSPTNNAFACCSVCNSFNLYIVELPHASKVFIQMLLPFNIHMRLIPSKKVILQSNLQTHQNI
jgi:DNA-directed RNA polymerase II subunit RPB2